MSVVDYSLCLTRTPYFKASDESKVLVREMRMDSRSDRLEIHYAHDSIDGEIFLDTRELGPRFPSYDRLYLVSDKDLQRLASSDVFGFNEEEQKEFLAELMRLKSLEEALIRGKKVVFPNVTNPHLPATKL